MTLEQKIKEIEELAKMSELYGCKFEQALEVIREQQKQLDRVRDTKKLASIIRCQRDLPHENQVSCHEYEADSIILIQSLQNYIFRG